MKVAKTTAYGGVDHIVFAQVSDPVPKGNEVLVQIKAAPVTSGDVRIRSGNVPRGFGLILRLVFGWKALRNPVQGWSFAGEAIGRRVFGIAGIKGGAYAEKIVVPVERILPMPDRMSFVTAAAFWFGGLTAATAVYDKAGVRAGERVLINGATGAVGSAMVHMAAHLGAEVTAVCSHADMARQLGAAHVIDYRTAQVTGEYDVIFDVIGNIPRPFRHLALGGRLCWITPDLGQNIGALIWPRRAGRRVFALVTDESPEKMARLLDLYHKGIFDPLVGQVFDFGDIRAAHTLVESMSKLGTVVLRIG